MPAMSFSKAATSSAGPVTIRLRWSGAGPYLSRFCWRWVSRRAANWSTAAGDIDLSRITDARRSGERAPRPVAPEPGSISASRAAAWASGPEAPTTVTLFDSGMGMTVGFWLASSFA